MPKEGEYPPFKCPMELRNSHLCRVEEKAQADSLLGIKLPNSKSEESIYFNPVTRTFD
jgi:hypothetical protein